MELFAEFCEHIKHTYQAFYNEEEKIVLIHALKPYRNLAEIAIASTGKDENQDIIAFFADKAINAVEQIAAVWSKPNEIADSRDPDFIWYDYEKDTPETI